MCRMYIQQNSERGAVIKMSETWQEKSTNSKILFGLQALENVNIQVAFLKDWLQITSICVQICNHFQGQLTIPSGTAGRKIRGRGLHFTTPYK